MFEVSCSVKNKRKAEKINKKACIPEKFKMKYAGSPAMGSRREQGSTGKVVGQHALDGSSEGTFRRSGIHGWEGSDPKLCFDQSSNSCGLTPCRLTTVTLYLFFFPFLESYFLYFRNEVNSSERLNIYSTVPTPPPEQDLNSLTESQNLFPAPSPRWLFRVTLELQCCFCSYLLGGQA